MKTVEPTSTLNLKQTEESSRIEPSIDSLLSEFISHANSGFGGIGLTVTLNGTVVTGIAIGVAEYMKELGKEMDIAGSTSVWSEKFTKLAERHTADIKAFEEAHPKLLAPCSFIHMKNARIISGRSDTPQDGTLWRGRLSQVDSWIMGVLS